MRRVATGAAFLLFLLAFGGCGEEDDAPPTVVVGVGDSITAGAPGWDPNPGLRERLDAHNPESQWTYWAAAELGERYDVRNCGVGGERTDEIATRLDACLTGAGVAVLQGGVNDLVQRRSPEYAARNLRAMVRRVRAEGITPIVTNLLPVNRRLPAIKRKIKRLNALIRRLARDEDVALVDFFGVLEDPAGAGRTRTEWTADGLHPSVEGYRRLGEAAARRVRSASR